MTNRFRRISERPVYSGQVISLTVGTFEAPDGSVFERDLVHHPGAVAVVPILDDTTAVLVRQFRAPVDEELLEIPAGKRDVDGEDPEVTARRELAEEVGLVAGRLEKVAEFYNSVGFCDELSHLYLAFDLTEVPMAAMGVEEEHMTVEKVLLDDVPRLIATGGVRDAKTIIGLLLAYEHVRQHGGR